MAVFCLCCGAVGCARGGRTQPQVTVRAMGERHAPLPPRAAVKLYHRGEPLESYREIGTITATCPEQQWIDGRQREGRPTCLAGLRTGARRLGAQAVVGLAEEEFLPPWEPERRWIIIRGTAIRLLY